MSVPGCRCRLYGGVVLCQAGRYCELLYLTLMLLSTDRLLGWSQGSSEDSVELRGETLHIYVDFLVGDTGVDLCRTHIRPSIFETVSIGTPFPKVMVVAKV